MVQAVKAAPHIQAVEKKVEFKTETVRAGQAPASQGSAAKPAVSAPPVGPPLYNEGTTSPSSRGCASVPVSEDRQSRWVTDG